MNAFVRTAATMVLAGGLSRSAGCRSTPVAAPPPGSPAAAFAATAGPNASDGPLAPDGPFASDGPTAGPALTETSSDGDTQRLPLGDRPSYEARAIARVIPHPPPADEVFALTGERPVGYGGVARTIEVTVRGAAAELRWYDEHLYRDGRSSGYFVRPLSADELGELRAFVRDRKVDALAHNEVRSTHGVDYVYLHATRESARRLVINNPDEKSGVYIELVRLFDRLADPAKLTVRHTLPRLPDGAELLYARADEWLQSVWAAGDDVRVLVGSTDAAPRWRSFKDGKMGAEVPTPDGRAYEHRVQRVVLEDGRRMMDPVATPDGLWAVGRVDDRLVRYGAADRRLAAVTPAVFAEQGHALAYLPTHGKVLVVRHRTYSSTYGLLDAATGRVEEVGVRDDRLLLASHARPWQPTARPDVVWGALELTPGGSLLGRYDLRAFEFRNDVFVPGLIVGSDQVWVDEPNGLAYAVDGKILFRFPLPKAMTRDRDPQPTAEVGRACESD